MLMLAQALEDADEAEAKTGKGAKAAGTGAAAAALGDGDSPAKVKAAAAAAAAAAKKSSAADEEKGYGAGKRASVTAGDASVPSSSSSSSPSSSPTPVTPSASASTPISTRAGDGVEAAAEPSSLSKGMVVAASPGGAGSPLSATETVGAGSGASREEAMVLELPDDHGHMVSDHVSRATWPVLCPPVLALDPLLLMSCFSEL